MDQFNEEFASHWDELVGWEKRSDFEITFLIDLLKKFNCKNILDVAVGTGFHAINFLKYPFLVTGVDISHAMIDIAKKNAIKHSVELDIICTDWTSLKDKVSKKYDCIICLGNSLACENDHNKRQLAIYNWSEVLTENGIIIVDRRNYEALLQGKNVINSKKLYCGKNVQINSDKVTNEKTVFSYTFPDKKIFKLQMYPILDHHIKTLFANADFTPVKIYGDRQLSFDENNVGFYHYIFKRNKHE